MSLPFVFAAAKTETSLVSFLISSSFSIMSVSYAASLSLLYKASNKRREQRRLVSGIEEDESKGRGIEEIINKIKKKLTLNCFPKL